MKNLMPKSDWIFLKEIKVCDVAQKTISRNWNQNTNQNREKLKKKRKSDLHMNNFLKQNYIEVESGVEDMNYEYEVAISTDFWKKAAERPKNENINRKKPKIN